MIGICECKFFSSTQNSNGTNFESFFVKKCWTKCWSYCISNAHFFRSVDRTIKFYHTERNLVLVCKSNLMTMRNISLPGIVITSLVSFTTSFTPKFLFETKIPRKTSSLLSAEKNSGDDPIDFTSLYNLNEKVSQEEAMKSGIGLTKAIRQITVDYGEEIRSIGNEIEGSFKAKGHTRSLLLLCLLYMGNGNIENRGKWQR